MITNPHMLPKVRSDALRNSAGDDGIFPQCELRIASFLGQQCSGGLVGVHLDGIAPAMGKGTGTKVSDLNMVVGCQRCHDLLARVNPGWQVLMDRYPAAAQRQIHMGHMATQARWVGSGLIVVPDGTII